MDFISFDENSLDKEISITFDTTLEGAVLLADVLQFAYFVEDGSSQIAMDLYTTLIDQIQYYGLTNGDSDD